MALYRLINHWLTVLAAAYKLVELELLCDVSLSCAGGRVPVTT